MMRILWLLILLTSCTTVPPEHGVKCIGGTLYYDYGYKIEIIESNYLDNNCLVK